MFEDASKEAGLLKAAWPILEILDLVRATGGYLVYLHPAH